MEPVAVAGPGLEGGGALGGARVVLFEGRMGSELAGLVRRHDGVALVAPAVREVSVDAAAIVATLIDRMDEGRIDVVVFLTGVGVETLMATAERIGRAAALERGLRGATTVCRGHKPRAALRRRGLPVSMLVAEPYTTADAIDTLSQLDLDCRGVAVVHHGERNTAIGDALRDLNCTVLDVCVYVWALPEDVRPLEQAIDAIIEGAVDAVAFTSQVQVRHLFAVAARKQRTLKLLRALNARVVVAAVGPTCAEALRAAGIVPRVVPTNPKMGPMIVALAEHFGASPAGTTGSRQDRDVER